jgi:hypothetical protein
VNPNFSLSQPASGILTIIPEDARTTYTGPFFASATARYEDDDDDDLKYRTANVTLSATIRDITATADAGGDESFGDIRNATVSFVDRDNGDAIIATVPVGLVSATDTKTGTASFNWSVNLGTADSKQLNVGVIVNGHYTRNSVVDNAVVEVIKPASDYIKGSGHLVLAGSAGDLAGDAGSRNDFSFEVKYNSSGSSLSGSISTTVRRGGRVYQIKGTTMRSLSVQPAATGGTATFVGKASVRDITNSNNPVTLDANAALQMTMGDAGTSGAADWIAIAAWKTGGGLWFSSNWDGTSTVQQSLGGGSLEVRGGTSRSVAQPAFARSTPSEVAGGALPLAFALPQNYPNPFTTSTNIRFELPERSRVTITIYDVTGREVANLVDGAVEPGAHLATWSGRTREGHPAGPGVYFVRMVAASLSGSAGYRSDRRLSLVK